VLKGDALDHHLGGLTAAAAAGHLKAVAVGLLCVACDHHTPTLHETRGRHAFAVSCLEKGPCIVKARTAETCTCGDPTADQADDHGSWQEASEVCMCCQEREARLGQQPRPENTANLLCCCQRDVGRYL
jgi:hypothetical protein